MGLNELIDISREYGCNPDFVLANGGNTSWKDNNSMYVKGSGVSLDGIDESGFVKMERSNLNAIWEKTYSSDPDEREVQALKDLMEARSSEEDGRPSVETLLHAIFPQAYVIHLHPAMVNGLTCGKKGKESAKKLFGADAVWISVVNPGYILAKTVKDIIGEHTSAGNPFPNIVFLQNHGVFVADNTLAGIRHIYSGLMDTLEQNISETPDLSEVSKDESKVDDWSAAIEMVLEKPECGFISNGEIEKLVVSKEAFTPLSSAYTPDHIIYYGHEPVFIDRGPSSADSQPGDSSEDPWTLINEGVTNYLEQNPGPPPGTFAVQGIGVFCIGNSRKRVHTMIDLFLDAVKISVYTKSFGGYNFMPKDKIDFIVNWEVEKFRIGQQAKGKQ